MQNSEKQLSPVKRALVKLRQMQARIDELEDTNKEAIAVVGLGCRFPGGSNSAEEYWTLLKEGRDAITEVPENRWDVDAYYDADPQAPGKIVTRWGGFIEETGEFDPDFFGISPREAETMDPQQRLLLETIWESLEHAAINPDTLKESLTGIFIGICGVDYSYKLLNRPLEDIDGYFCSGNTHSMATGRLSYILGLQGPNIAIDTACSSSLIATHLACQSLRSRECDLALTGGVNRILSPEISICLSKAEMLSSDGRCKTFDVTANGYVRAEGCGIFVLKRLSDAESDGDSIIALIRGSAMNQDGRSSGLTAPNGPSQEAVIKKALDNAGVNPIDVSYIEAHGTGTSLGDPIEVGALANVYGLNRSALNPLLLGSAKTNVGHMEGASGIVSLIKVALALKHKMIPASLHFNNPSPFIDWDSFSVKVPTEATRWETESSSRFAGISSFGFSGSNSHIIMEEAPATVSEEQESRLDHLEGQQLLTLSAKNEQSLTDLVNQYIAYLSPDLSSGFRENLSDICFTAQTGRAHFSHRIAVVAQHAKGFVDLLKEVDTEKNSSSLFKGLNTVSNTVTFLFSAEGAVYPGMGKELYDTFPSFRKTIDQCESLVNASIDKSLISLMWGENTELLNNEVYARQALFALEYALAQLWSSWGVQPDQLLGKGVGEISAACFAGVFSLEDAIKLLLIRDGEMDKGGPDSIAFNVPRLRIISSMTGQAIHAEMGDLHYWKDQVNAPMQVEKALSVVSEKSDSLLLAIGPGTGNKLEMMKNLGQLYVKGIFIDWKGVNSDTKRKKVVLPKYPFQRQFYWLDESRSRRSELSQLKEPVSQWLYEVEWRIKSFASPLVEGKLNTQEQWLIFADKQGLGEAVAAQLESNGASCTLVFAGTDFIRESLGRYHIDSSQLKHYQNVFIELMLDQVTLGNILFCWGLDSTPIEETNLNTLQQDQKMVCGSALLLVQSVACLALHKSPKLSIVTRGGCAVEKQEGEINIAQWPLLGLAKVIKSELPELRCSTIDLDSSDIPRGYTEEAKEIFQELVCAEFESEFENEIAYRQSIRMVSRLVESTIPDFNTDNETLKISPEKSYLITGGLGGLGLLCARKFAENGAKSLILIGRKGIKSEQEQQVISGLISDGVMIHVAQVDVSDAQGMNDLFVSIETSMPPLGGVVHSAGVLDDGIVIEQEWSRFTKVFSPKIDGAWNLHQNTKKLDLDFFVLFSSASSVLGIPGQGNYSAANSFLDGLAHYRRHNGLKALSINWGPWDEIGMAVADQVTNNLSRVSGVEFIEPEKGIEVLMSLLGSNQPQQTVAPFDWSEISTLMKSRVISPLLKDFIQHENGGQDAAHYDSVKLLQKLQGKKGGERKKILEKYLLKEVRQVLGLEESKTIDSQQPLQELGLDSLTAVELRNIVARGINKEVPVSVLFDYPSVDALIQFLDQETQDNFSIDNRSKADTALRAGLDLESDPVLNTISIAIIGTSCRFPGHSNSLSSYWDLLKNGIDGVEDLKNKRWDIDSYYDPDPEVPGKMIVRRGGTVDDIELFDAPFFGMSSKEATTLDPQQRLLLETSWESIETAGYSPAKLSGLKGGIFVGAGPNDFFQQHASQIESTEIDGYLCTGNSTSVLAGRLSYFFGWVGPSIAIDTACSSSLVAVHMACQSLRLGECDFALSGGVNLTLSPLPNIALSKAMMLSPDGKCKTFDASANGYVRSEGCGVVLLKRLNDAITDDDNILAVIRGSAVNQDGRSQGLTAPNGLSQETVIRNALKESGVDPASINYVEAHGTGTPLGDPIEVHALDRIYGQAHSVDNPLYIGSVKTNIGHTETAAGVAGLIKILLSFKHEMLPPHLHLQNISEHLGFVKNREERRVRIPTKITPWKTTTEKRRGAISSFGFSGTNAHMIVEEAPLREMRNDEPVRSHHIMTLSAKNEFALKDLAYKYRDYLIAKPSEDIANICFTANTGRSHFEHRFSSVGCNSAEMLQRLNSFLNQEKLNGLFLGADDYLPSKTAFLFPDEDSQYVVMGQELFTSVPLFKEIVSRCDEQLSKQSNTSILSVFLEPLSENTYSQTVLFVIEVALAKVWLSWGISPDYIMGDGVGEFAAAVIAGVMDLEEGLKLVAARERYLDPKQADYTFAEFSKVSQKIQFHSPSIPLYSPYAGCLVRHEMSNSTYWIQREQQKIGSHEIYEGFETLLNEHVNRYLEIGPGRHLLDIGQRISTSKEGSSQTWLASFGSDRNTLESMLYTLAELYTQGLTIEWSEVEVGYPRYRISLPTYPFQRKRHWPSVSKQADSKSHPLLGSRTFSVSNKETIFENSFSVNRPINLDDHRLYETVLLPGAGHLSLVVEAAKEVCGDGTYRLRGVTISQPLILSADEQRVLQYSLSSTDDNEYRLQCFSRDKKESGDKDWTSHIQCEVSFLTDETKQYDVNDDINENISEYHHSLNEKDKASESIEGDVLYEDLWNQGYHFGPTFRWIKKCWRNPGESWSHLRKADSSDDANRFMIHPGLLDACFQTTALASPADTYARARADSEVIYIPFGVDEFVFYGIQKGELWCHTKLRSSDSNNQETYVHDIELFDESGKLVLSMKGARSKRATKHALLNSLRNNNLFYELNWKRQDIQLEELPSVNGNWLIYCDQKGIGKALSEKMQAMGAHCVCVYKDDVTTGTTTGIAPGDAHLDGVVYLWGLDAVESHLTNNLTLLEDEKYVCGGLLGLTQEILKLQGPTPPRMWIVTQQTQVILENESVGSLVSGSLWGMGRSLTMEHPEFSSVLIDLEIDTPDICVAHLLREMISDFREGQIVYRKMQRYVARLGAVKIKEVSPPENEKRLTKISIHNNASYLITGGLGDIGLQLAQWLVSKGARHLVLTGRNRASEKTQQIIDRFKSVGVQVTVSYFDIADACALTEVFDTIVKTMPPLKGIIHSAGTLSDGMMINQTWSDYEAVMQSKVLGTWNLHNEIQKTEQENPLDFFYLFSSAASMFGSPGQANYAAANGFMDTFAHFRRTKGLPATSINWGAWSDIGMAAGKDQQTNASKMVGISLISPKEAISALDELGSYRLNAQVSIMPVNWHRFSEGFDGKIPPFFEEFDRNTASGKMSSGSASNRNTSLEKGFTDMQKTFLSSASAEERLDFLKDFISEKIIHVMGLDDSVILSPVQPLLNIGLDSLVAVELKNIIGAAIGKTLPATLMFDYPTITELARFINGELDFVSTIGSPIDIDSGININSPTNIAHIEVDSDSTKILVEDARINRIQNLASNEVDILFDQMFSEIE